MATPPIPPNPPAESLVQTDHGRGEGVARPTSPQPPEAPMTRGEYPAAVPLAPDPDSYLRPTPREHELLQQIHAAHQELKALGWREPQHAPENTQSPTAPAPGL